EGYRLDLRNNDWWGEPLDGMLGRVLVADLSQRLPQVTVFLSSGAVTGSPEAIVELEVQRMDIDTGNNLMFAALGSVSFKGQSSSETRSFHISQPVASPAADAQVAAASAALGQVADGIAAMLTSRPSHK
ncbi:MAG TPA: ABC-type transport auxiliary lipoprotein family protein, partial [Rhodopila sp.]